MALPGPGNPNNSGRAGPLERSLIGTGRGPSFLGMWFALLQHVLVVLRCLLLQGSRHVVMIRGQVPAMAPPAALLALVRREGDVRVRIWPRLRRFGVVALRGGSCMEHLRRGSRRYRCEFLGRGRGWCSHCRVVLSVGPLPDLLGTGDGLGVGGATGDRVLEGRICLVHPKLFEK